MSFVYTFLLLIILTVSTIWLPNSAQDFTFYCSSFRHGFCRSGSFCSVTTASSSPYGAPRCMDYFIPSHWNRGQTQRWVNWPSGSMTRWVIHTLTHQVATGATVFTGIPINRSRIAVIYRVWILYPFRNRTEVSGSSGFRHGLRGGVHFGRFWKP